MAEPGKNLTSSLPPSPLPSYMATTNEEVQTDPLSQSFSETAATRRHTLSSVNGPIVKSAGGIEPADVFHHSYKSQTSTSSVPANADTYVFVARPNNEIEAHKIANNHLVNANFFSGVTKLVTILNINKVILFDSSCLS